MNDEAESKSQKRLADHVKDWSAIVISLAALGVSLLSFRAQIIPDIEGSITIGLSSVYSSSDIASPLVRVEVDLFNYGNRPILLSAAVLYLIPDAYENVVAGRAGICDLNRERSQLLNTPTGPPGSQSGWEPQAVDGQKVLPFVVAAPAFDKFDDAKVKSGLLCAMLTTYDTFGRRDIEQLPVGAAQFAVGKSKSETRMNQLTRMDFLPRRRNLHFVDPGN